MRIIIESQDSEAAGNAILLRQPGSFQISGQDLNAGPSAGIPFLQGTATQTAISNGSGSMQAAGMQGINAGSPPQWLLDAIAKATPSSSSSQAAVSDLNAGAAPVM